MESFKWAVFQNFETFPCSIFKEKCLLSGSTRPADQCLT